LRVLEQPGGLSTERLRKQVGPPKRTTFFPYMHTHIQNNKTDTPRYAPFVYDAWKSPETLAIVSSIAGIDLVTEMDFEIAHINMSVKTPAQKEAEEEEERRKPWLRLEDDAPLVGWHTDSYPFVCVTMLSDCTNMVGGETMLRTGTGDVMKIRSPQMVLFPSSFFLPAGAIYLFMVE
jgi:hypothetical protein